MFFLTILTWFFPFIWQSIWFLDGGNIELVLNLFCVNCLFLDCLPIYRPIGHILYVMSVFHSNVSCIEFC